MSSTFGSNEVWNQFGNPIGVWGGESRWFRGDPKVEERNGELVWPCPIPDCSGEMKDTGWSWPMSPPGIHHQCTVCGFQAALHDEQYPRRV